MSMYSITQKTNGDFWCECRIQDGVESWTDPNMRTAVENMKNYAKLLNGVTINEKNIYLKLKSNSRCSACGCDCPGCGCRSGCCVKCGCCNK